MEQASQIWAKEQSHFNTNILLKQGKSDTDIDFVIIFSQNIEEHCNIYGEYQ